MSQAQWISPQLRRRAQPFLPSSCRRRQVTAQSPETQGERHRQSHGVPAAAAQLPALWGGQVRWGAALPTPQRLPLVLLSRPRKPESSEVIAIFHSSWTPHPGVEEVLGGSAGVLIAFS